MPALERIRVLGDALGEASAKATATQAAVTATSEVAQQARVHLDAVGTSAAASGTALEDAVRRIEAAVNQIVSLLEGNRQKIEATASDISAKASQLEGDVTRTVESVGRSIDELHSESTTRLDDLLQILNTTKNAWDVDLIAMIGAVKVGLIPLQELLDKYGEANIQGERLFEFLDGIPLNTYATRIQTLIDTLADGTGSVEKIKDFLAQSDLQFSQNLLKSIDLFKQGKGSLEAIADLVRNILKAFPDSQFADLAEAIQRGLESGSLR